MSSGIDMSFVVGRANAGGPRTARGSDDIFRVVVVGDLSGRASRRAADPDPPSFRPQRVDLDSFDQVFARYAPRLHLAAAAADAAAGPVRLELGRFEDFEPDHLLTQPFFTRLRDLRARLADPASFEQAAAELRCADAGSAAPAEKPAAAGEDDSATLERLLGRPAGGSGAAAPGRPAAAGVDAAVEQLARAAVAPHIVAEASPAQQPLIDALDRTISASMRAVLRDPHWRAVEGAWHAIDRFVHGVENSDGQVRLELVDASAADLLDSLVAAQADPLKMPLATALRSGQRERGDAPCAVIAALYPFGGGAAELALLAALGAVAAGQGALLLAGADPALALIDAPDGFDGVAAMQPDSAAQARWRTLRSSPLAPHVGLVWPRVLTRLPYGPKTQPVTAFAFDELADAPDHEHLPWRVAALDLAALLAGAYGEAGWDLQPQSAVEIGDLPAYIDRSGDEPRLQAVAELYLSERQASAVAAAGVMPLLSDRSQPRARVAVWRGIGTDAGRLAGPWASETHSS